MTRTLIVMPERARPGEVLEIKAMVEHVMETGFRHTEQGERVPRNIIRQFRCLYNGDTVFQADFHPAMVSNPVVQFFVRADRSGNFEFEWSGDQGFTAHVQKNLVVS